jgi:predicted RNA-binding Zn-ribbon protein involved in translation (DUF1610 family)
MNSENESKPTYEPILQRRLDMMADVISLWLQASDEKRAAVMRIIIDQERLEAKLGAPRLLSDCPACGGQIGIPQCNDTFFCDECGAQLVREVRIATEDEVSKAA